jgi:hypothetical protein
VTTTRKQLADAIRDLLPDTYLVVHYPTAFNGGIGNANDGTLVIERRSVNPANTAGSYDEGFNVWVLVGVEDEEAAEDALDAALVVALGALARVDWCTNPTATRAMYGDLHGYRLEITIKTTKE